MLFNSQLGKEQTSKITYLSHFRVARPVREKNGRVAGLRIDMHLVYPSGGSWDECLSGRRASGTWGHGECAGISWYGRFNRILADRKS